MAVLLGGWTERPVLIRSDGKTCRGSKKSNIPKFPQVSIDDFKNKFYYYRHIFYHEIHCKTFLISRGNHLAPQRNKGDILASTSQKFLRISKMNNKAGLEMQFFKN